MRRQSKDERRAHDFLDAFEAEVAERSRAELDAELAKLKVEAVLDLHDRLEAFVGCLMWRHPEAVKHQERIVEILTYMAPFVDSRVWGSDEELARLVVATYWAAKACVS